MDGISNKEEVRKIVKEIIEEDLDRIVEKHLLNKEKKFENVSILERIIVIEESLKNTNKRLEDLIHYIDKRFEQVDKRFKDLNKHINFISWFIPTIITIIVIVLKFV